jgi:hypothetical protein
VIVEIRFSIGVGKSKRKIPNFFEKFRSDGEKQSDFWNFKTLFKS